MANIMDMFKALNKPSRNGFDLGKWNRFTAKAGELLPVYSKLVRKGDKFNVNTQFITNTRPLNSDAYCSIREYYNWYFVPMHLMWDKFNEWSVDLKDNVQVASSINGNTPLSERHPYFTTAQIYDVINGLDNLSLEQNKLNIFGFERGRLARKLMHYLDYGDFYKPENSIIRNLEMNPWRLLAYNKIYQDWHRDSQWESARPALFNLNYMTGAEGTNQIPMDEMDLTKWTMCDIRYANWQKDYFMGLLPNSQFGDAASVDMGSLGIQLNSPTELAFSNVYNEDYNPSSPRITAFNGSGQDIKKVLNSAGGYSSINNDGTVVTSGFDRSQSWYFNQGAITKLRQAIGLPSNSTSSMSSAFTILALRQAEALQKYKEIKMANKQDFPSQVYAQEGYKPSDAYSHRSIWLKGFDSTIDINPVVNTNLADANAAVIRGRGLSAGQGNFTFDAEVDGVLMCIYHAVPILDYAIDGIHPDNLKTYLSDYANPIFDRTGMQQVHLANLMNNDPDFPLFDNHDETLLLGYGPIYLDYKTDYTTIHGAFYNGGLESWVAPISAEYIRNWLEGNQSGDYAFWKGLNANFFKVDPATLNPIFTTPVDSEVNSDQFWCNVRCSVSAVRNLDRDGLPY